MAEGRAVALVTGASRGIGAAVAIAAAATFDVVINHTGTGDLAAVGAVVAAARARGARVLVHAADVADERAVVDMFRRVDDELGPVGALVNNAGIAGGYGTIDVVDAAMMARLLAVNVTGAFLCAREAVARMSTAHGGSGGAIVNVSSKAAVLGGADEWVHYAASKGAIDTMTVGLARELATCGVRVNGVRPGLIASDFHDHAPPGRIERMAPAIPMERAGTPEEVAAAVVWLLGPEASYVTGTTIDVSGGR